MSVEKSYLININIGGENFGFMLIGKIPNTQPNQMSLSALGISDLQLFKWDFKIPYRIQHLGDL